MVHQTQKELSPTLTPQSIARSVLCAPEQFDFGQCLVFLNRSKQERTHWVVGRSVRRLLKLAGGFLLLDVSNPAERVVQIEYLNRKPTQTERTGAETFVCEWFDLDRDLTPFHAMAQRDKLLATLVHHHHGLRLLKIHDLFQALCWAVLGQQINVAFAYTLYRRFIEAFGESYVWNGQTYWLFPTAKTVAELSANSLRALQLTGRKSEYIIGIAKALASGEISKASLLADEDYAHARRALLRIRGVGPWTASYVLMRCLGDPGAFPIEDIGLHNAIRLQLGRETKPALEEIRSMAESWTNWQAYAAFYLYRSLL
ncbi:MAG: DNA-3-methyladenine glycosylase [Calditrichaeota bacterium]|nr:DNA-3-methyladenine glycosylase [Calditrichota bacterium]